MTDIPIDPAATPEDEDAARIAAADAGASAIAERAGRRAEGEDPAAEEEGVDGEGV